MTPIAGAIEIDPARPRTHADRARGVSPPFPLVAAALFASAMVLSPIVFTVIQATGVSAEDATELLFRSVVGRLLVNTITLTVAAAATTAVIGAATAWLVERTDLPGRKVWAVLAVAPLAIPPFISSFAWVSLSNGLQDFAGALLVVTCAYYPLVYLPVAAALRGLDPALEETARSLGQTSWGCFFRVVLPQLRPALYGGVLLVALKTLSEFGAFALLRFETFTTELFAQFRTGFDGPPLSLLAVVLLVLCIACLVGEMKVRGRSRYARVGAGVRRNARLAPLGWTRWPVLLGFVVLNLATLGTPLGMVAFWLTQHASAATSRAAASLPRLFDATVASVGYGLAGAAAALLLAAPLGYLTTRYPSRWTVLLERTAYLTQGVPGIVVALALVSIAVDWIPPALSERDALSGRLRHSVPAVRAGQRARGHGASASWTRGGGSLLRAWVVWARSPGASAAGRAGSRGRRHDGVRLRLHGVDSDTRP
jgi:iron(III) transport system permease protein